MAAPTNAASEDSPCQPGAVHTWPKLRSARCPTCRLIRADGRFSVSARPTPVTQRGHLRYSAPGHRDLMAKIQAGGAQYVDVIFFSWRLLDGGAHCVAGKR